MKLSSPLPLTHQKKKEDIKLMNCLLGEEYPELTRHLPVPLTQDAVSDNGLESVLGRRWAGFLIHQSQQPMTLSMSIRECASVNL